jgi:predicted outer membrane repeat protein
MASAFASIAGGQKVLEVPAHYSTIQAAIDAASGSDTVLVAPGTYRERIDFKGKAIHVLGRDGAAVTTLDGEKKGSVVTFQNREGTKSILEGFTIIQGKGTGPYPSHTGGGVTCEKDTAPTIYRNRFTLNESQLGGAILCLQDSTPLILENVFIRNTGDWGAAIHSRAGQPIIRGNRFERNVAGSEGGALHVMGGSLTIEHNEFLYNRARTWGGAVAFRDSTGSVLDSRFVGNLSEEGGAVRTYGNCRVDIVNNRFHENVAIRDGGALYTAGTITLTNNTVVANLTVGLGGGVWAHGSGMTVTNCIFWDNWAKASPEIHGTPQVTYSDVRGGFTGAGNLDIDPGFVDRDSGDLHLRHDSPVKDKGSNQAPALASTDFEGNVRIAGGTVDMGADEFAPHAWTRGRLTAGGRIRIRVAATPNTPAEVAVGLHPEPRTPPVVIPGVGPLYIQGPFALIPLGSVPASGIAEVELRVPESFPSPRRFPLQALIGGKLSGLHLFEIRGRVLAVPERLKTVQAAIDAAVDHDTVMVAPGRYVENLDFKGKAIWVVSRTGREWTTLDGGKKGAVVKFDTHEDREARLAGFTIRNGTESGIHMTYRASPTIEDNRITGNTAWEGGGINALYGWPIIRGNEIVANKANGHSAAKGGGMYLGNSPFPEVLDNLIQLNEAHVGGGMAMETAGRPLIRGNRILSNTVDQEGGGMACGMSYPVRVEQNVIAFNVTTYGKGGGIQCHPHGPDLVNCTIYGNEARFGGGGVYADSTNAAITNCIVRGNRSPSGGQQIHGTFSSNPPTVTFSNVQGGWKGTGNIDVDPRFVDPSYDDFHLRFDSPCRDTGTSPIADLAPHDMEGDPRIVGGKVDIGADEFHRHVYHTGNAEPGRRIWLKVIGRPGESVVWAVSMNPVLLDPPMVFPGRGAYHLAWPVVTAALGRVPSEGVIRVLVELPGYLPVPMPLPHQAIVEDQFTNVGWIRVR